MEHSVEELLNTLTHGIGALLSVAGLCALLITAAPMGDTWRTLSFTIFGLSLTALYLASTLYHAARCRWMRLASLGMGDRLLRHISENQV